MSYQDLLVTIWQLAFHCFSSNRSDNIIMYGMQPIGINTLLYYYITFVLTMDTFVPLFTELFNNMN